MPAIYPFEPLWGGLGGRPPECCLRRPKADPTRGASCPASVAFPGSCPGTILASSSIGVGLHRLAAVVPVGRWRTGNAKRLLFRSRPSACRGGRLIAAEELLICGAGLSAKGACNVWAPRGSCRGARLLLTSRFVYGLPASRSGSALPFDQPRPDRGTIQETKTGRPTPSLKRTAEAF